MITTACLLFNSHLSAEIESPEKKTNSPFHVEMIVFQHEAQPDQRWWPPVKINPFAKLVNPPTITVGEELSKPKQKNHTQKKQLSDSLKKLQQSSKYNVLFYSSWKQAQTSSINPTLLKAGGQYGDHHELIGSVGLVGDKELQLTLDFWWREFSPITSTNQDIMNPHNQFAAGPEQTVYQIARNFHLQQQQSLQPNQIYYVDSPVLGMLVLLTPVTNASAD